MLVARSQRGRASARSLLLAALIVVAVTLLTVAGCGDDNLALCDGCGTPTPTPTLTPSATLSATPAATFTPALL